MGSPTLNTGLHDNSTTWPSGSNMEQQATSIWKITMAGALSDPERRWTTNKQDQQPDCNNHAPLKQERRLPNHPKIPISNDPRMQVSPVGKTKPVWTTATRSRSEPKATNCRHQHHCVTPSPTLRTRRKQLVKEPGNTPSHWEGPLEKTSEKVSKQSEGSTKRRCRPLKTFTAGCISRVLNVTATVTTREDVAHGSFGFSVKYLPT